MSANSSALAASAAASVSSAGSSRFVAASSAARWTADGKTSFDDWPRFTWSLGWTPSPARFAITSLAFMLDEVPEPVWKTSIGNWSSWRPSATSSAPAAIRSATAASSRPEVGVHPRGRGLDPPQPVDDRRRDRLAGDGEVLDRLSGLATPQLGLPGHVGHRAGDYRRARARRDIRQAWRRRREAAAGGSKRGGEGGRGVVGEGLAVADGDGRRGDSSERAARREGADEGMHADRLDVIGEEVADRAEHIRRDEEAAVGDPERPLVPAGEAERRGGPRCRRAAGRRPRRGGAPRSRRRRDGGGS